MNANEAALQFRHLIAVNETITATDLAARIAQHYDAVNGDPRTRAAIKALENAPLSPRKGVAPAFTRTHTALWADNNDGLTRYDQ